VRVDGRLLASGGHSSGGPPITAAALTIASAAAALTIASAAALTITTVDTRPSCSRIRASINAAILLTTTAATTHTIATAIFFTIIAYNTLGGKSGARRDRAPHALQRRGRGFNGDAMELPRPASSDGRVEAVAATHGHHCS
jgi:hypothetical protein